MSDMQSKYLYTPSQTRRKSTRLATFMLFVKEREGQDCGAPDEAGFKALHTWSIEEPERFWNAVWDFTGVIGDKGSCVIQNRETVPWARFFPDSKLSYSENILKAVHKKPDEPAIIARTQDGPDRTLSWQKLYNEVSRWEQALRAAGLKENDHIGVYLPQLPETIIIFLAASNIGAVFASAGMEMGGDDLINRFGQVKPKILIAGESYIHGKKHISRADVIMRAQNEISSLEKIILLSPPRKRDHDQSSKDEPEDKYPDASHHRHDNMNSNTENANTENADIFLAPYSPQNINFIRRDFNHPLYILFSSGSTGAPKCFEHSSGGILLKHLCEHQLHIDIKSGDRLFYHSTPSWMMWNWLVSALACEASILMYDGNPFYPDAYAQLDFTAQNACTHHGTAAPVILAWADQGVNLTGRYDNLSLLRSMIYTGAVLPDYGFEYIHEKLKSDIKIAPITGGTDLVGSLMGGNPFAPTYAGQINGPILGLDIQIWDEQGQEVAIGEGGELVCANAFPSMPLRFIGDDDGSRYKGEYFEHFEGRKVWRHGDSVLKTPENQYVIIGRSDATLNQNGVRIGAAAIYKQLEPFSNKIADAAAVDFIRPKDKQTLTVLFLSLKDGAVNVDEELMCAIKRAVKNNITPYAIPGEILAVPDILKTPNGKKAEVVIKKIINGAHIPNPSLYGKELVQVYETIGAKLKTKYGRGI